MIDDTKLRKFLKNPNVATEDGSCGLKGTVLDLLTPETVIKALQKWTDEEENEVS